MNSKWMCISHHLPKYVFNRFQQCEISGGLSQISGIRSIVKRRFGKSLRVLECLRRHRVDPGLSDSVFASGFIRAINMDRSQSQLAKKYWVKSEEWVEATRHVTRVLPKQQVLCNVYQLFHISFVAKGFASRPISKFRLPQRRRAVWADLPQSREDPLTALQMDIWSNASGRWKSCSLVGLDLLDQQGQR